MSLDSKITTKYDNGYVQVEIGSKNFDPKYYKVPEDKADEFIKDYKANKSKNDRTSSVILIAAILAVLFPIAHFTKKIQDKTIRTVLNVGVGVLGGIGSMSLSNKIEQKSHKNLMQKYNAEEIHNQKPTVIV